MEKEETCERTDISNEETNEPKENASESTLLRKRPGETPRNPMSKRQLKKQLKRAKFESTKKEKKLKEKEKARQKRLEAIALGLPATNGPSRKQLKKLEQENKNKGAGSKIAFDLDYDEEMNDADVSKCLKQLLRVYSINRRSSKPCDLHFTGIKTEGKVHNSFKRNDGWENWQVVYHLNKSHTEVFPKENLIYLTCESDEVLETLEQDKIYVIGGLVDHNHYKGLCHDRATKAGLKTVRLPLSEYVDMKTRQVLSTYHVFEILLRVNEGKSWTEAIVQTLPMRKGAKPKTPVKTDTSSEGVKEDFGVKSLTEKEVKEGFVNNSQSEKDDTPKTPEKSSSSIEHFEEKEESSSILVPEENIDN